MSIEKLTKILQGSIDFALDNEEDLDAASRNYQEGILITVNEAKLLLDIVKNCSIPNVVLSLPDDEVIEQWWAEGKESDKFWQDAPYRTNGDVVEEIKTALKYFITVWQ